MKNFDFISSGYNAKTGDSYVFMGNGKDTVIGLARLHPEDKDHGSEITGCRIAELRALIKIAKKEKARALEEYTTCKNFVSAIQCYKTFNPEEASAKAVFRQLNRKKREVEYFTNLIFIYQDAISLIIRNKDILNKRIASKQEN